MNKDEMIKKMAGCKLCLEYFGECPQEGKTCYDYKQATNIYNAGYRKIADDEIVIKKSDYETEQERAFLEWRDEYDQNCLLRLRVSELEKQLEKIKKETATEILKDLDDEGYKIYKRQGDTFDAGNFNWLIAYAIRKYDVELDVKTLYGYKTIEHLYYIMCPICGSINHLEKEQDNELE